MFLRFQGLDDLQLLLRRHTAEYGKFLYRFRNILFGMQRRRIHPAIGVFEAGFFGDVRDRDRIVTGNHLQIDALVRKVLQRFPCTFADFVADQHHRDGRDVRRQGLGVFPAKRRFAVGEDQNALAARRRRVRLFAQLPRKAVPEHEFPGADDVGADGRKADAAPLACGGEGDLRLHRPAWRVGAEILHRQRGWIVVIERVHHRGDGAFELRVRFIR